MGAHFAYHSGVSDVRPAVGGDVVVVDWTKGIGAFDSLLGRVCWVVTDALAESSKFVGVGGIPDFFVGRVVAELAMFELFAGCGIKDRARLWACWWRWCGR